MMMVDAVIIAAAAVVFGDISATLYAAVQVFVCSVTVDRVLIGREEGRLMLVVTTKEEAVRRAVTALGRSTTVVRALGGYSGEKKTLVLCAVSRVQLPLLQECIGEIDPAAFAMVLVTRQVVGEGFSTT